MTPFAQPAVANHPLRKGLCHSLDGRTIELKGDLDFSLPWTASIAFLQAGREVGFVEGLREVAEDLRIAHPLLTYSQEYSHQGGTLRIGSSPAADEYALGSVGFGELDRFWVGAWIGISACVYTTTRSTHDVTDDLVARFAGIQITESDNGLILNSGSGATISRLGMTKEVPRLGVLNIHDSGHPSAPSAPAWEGQKTDGGELYVDRDQGYFLLVTETAIASIQPVNEGDRLEDPERLSLIQQLRIYWS